MGTTFVDFIIEKTNNPPIDCNGWEFTDIVILVRYYWSSSRKTTDI